jgi:hypothetical protein
MSPTGSRAQAQILKKISTVLLSKLLNALGHCVLRISARGQRRGLTVYLFIYLNV